MDLWSADLGRPKNPDNGRLKMMNYKMYVENYSVM